MYLPTLVPGVRPRGSVILCVVGVLDHLVVQVRVPRPRQPSLGCAVPGLDNRAGRGMPEHERPRSAGQFVVVRDNRRVHRESMPNGGDGILHGNLPITFVANSSLRLLTMPDGIPDSTAEALTA